MTTTQTVLYWIKLNWKNLALILSVLIILLMFKCDPEPSLVKEHKANAKENLNVARGETKKTDNVIIDYKKTISDKDKEITNYKIKLANSQKTLNAKLSDLKQYKNSNIVVYYQDRYNITEGLKSIDTNTIAVKDNVSRLVISDLIKYDGLKYDTPILKSMLVASNQKYEVANKTIDTLKISINNISSAYESANESKDNVITSIEKQVRSERRKKNIWKITAFGVLAGAVYLSAK